MIREYFVWLQLIYRQGTCHIYSTNVSQQQRHAQDYNESHWTISNENAIKRHPKWKTIKPIPIVKELHI